MVKIDVMPFVPYLNHSRIKFVPLQTFPILKQVKAVRLRSGVSSNSLFQANCSPEVDLKQKKMCQKKNRSATVAAVRTRLLVKLQPFAAVFSNENNVLSQLLFHSFKYA